MPESPIRNGQQCDTLTAQLAEIDENLCRSELTPTQEAEHLAKRKEVWEAMRESEQVEQVVPAVEVAKHGHTQAGGFASETAKATGKTKQSVNRAIRRASEVCQEARDLAR